MPLTSIVVEDGTGLANANMYASLATVRQFALDRGVTLSVDDAVLTPKMFATMDFIEGKNFKGCRATSTQALSFPRNDIRIDGVCLPSSPLPLDLVNGFCQAAMEIAGGLDVMPTQLNDAGFITQETVGPISTSYSDKFNAGGQPYLPKVDRWLAPLLTDFGRFRVGHA